MSNYKKSDLSKMFSYGDLDINVVKEGDDVWFKAKDVALALGYKDTDTAIRDHVKENEKKVQQASPARFGRVVKTTDKEDEKLTR